jgi:hypothetical protein
MKAVFAKYGLPWGIYTDKASWFHPSRRKSRTPFDPNAEIKKKPQSQIGRALEELGIEFIPAHSPQAKGRVERLNGVLQDRMIAELKLAKIKTLQDANHFIDQVFIPDYNRRFAIQAAEPQASAFVKLAQPKVLDDILPPAHSTGAKRQYGFTQKLVRNPMHRNCRENPLGKGKNRSQDRHRRQTPSATR